MNFLKGVVSICHSFRDTGQPGRINGFDRCFQVVYRCTAMAQLRMTAAITRWPTADLPVNSDYCRIISFKPLTPSQLYVVIDHARLDTDIWLRQDI